MIIVKIVKSFYSDIMFSDSNNLSRPIILCYNDMFIVQLHFFNMI
jgi:hypothetical protein